MKKSLRHLAPCVLFCLAAASCSETPEREGSQPATSPRAARGTIADMEITALVKDVDADKRLITLEGPRGNTGVYRVGDQVQRFSEIRAGDRISARYQVGAVAELREPTAEEKNSPIAIVEASDRATADAPPAAGIGRAVRVVTTIDALDRSARTLTVKGPLDGLVTVHVEDPAAFERLQVGQNIIVTFAEKLILSLEPGSR